MQLTTLTGTAFTEYRQLSRRPLEVLANRGVQTFAIRPLVSGRSSAVAWALSLYVKMHQGEGRLREL